MLQHHLVPNPVVDAKCAGIVAQILAAGAFPGRRLWQVVVEFLLEVVVREVGVEVPVRGEGLVAELAFRLDAVAATAVLQLVLGHVVEELECDLSKVRNMISLAFKVKRRMNKTKKLLEKNQVKI